MVEYPEARRARGQDVPEVRPQADRQQLQAGPLPRGDRAHPQPGGDGDGGSSGVGRDTIRHTSRGTTGDEEHVRGDARAPDPGPQRRLHRLQNPPLRRHRGVRGRGEGPGVPRRHRPHGRPTCRPGQGAPAHHHQGRHREGGAGEDSAGRKGSDRPPQRLLLRRGRRDPRRRGRTPAPGAGRHPGPRGELHGWPPRQAPDGHAGLFGILRRRDSLPTPTNPRSVCSGCRTT